MKLVRVAAREQRVELDGGVGQQQPRGVPVAVRRPAPRVVQEAVSHYTLDTPSPLAKHFEEWSLMMMPKGADQYVHHLAMATHQFFHERGYYYAHTPIITASDCEGAGELFRVSTLPVNDAPKNDKGSPDFEKDYFGTETFLAVSGQQIVSGSS